MIRDIQYHMSLEVRSVEAARLRIHCTYGTSVCICISSHILLQYTYLVLSRRSASASLWPAAPSSPPCRAAVRLDGSVCAMKKTSRGCTIGAHAQTAAAASSSRSPCRSSQPSACSPSTSVTRGLSCMASTTGASGAGWERTHTSRCSTTHASPPISSHNLPLRSKP